MPLIDTHAHLDFPEYAADLPDVMERARKNGIFKIITIGCSRERNEKAIELSKKYKNVWCTVSLHPEDVKPGLNILEFINTLETLIQNNKKIVAVGETGLDYHYPDADKELQKEMFIEELKLAEKHNLPVIIHSRDAQDDMFDILQKYTPKKAVLHCFAGNEEITKKYLDLGLYLSFTGIITFKNARDSVTALKVCPLERLMIETDCPFLAPEPFRGKRNEPSYVNEIAKKISEIKNIPYEKVEKITKKNAEDFFGI